MAIDAAKADALKTDIGFARKRDLAFGLCIGKSPETTVLVCHKTKDPEALGRQAKKEGETAKMTYGLMKVEGKNLNLSCQGDVPSGLARRTREMLKAAGLKLKVRILDADGNSLEEDGEDEDLPPAEAEGAAEDPLAAEWAQARERADARVAATRDLPGHDVIRDAWQKAINLADEGDLRAGLMALEALDRQMDMAEAAAQQTEADKARWEAAAAKLRPIIGPLVEQATPAAMKLKAVWGVVIGKVEAGVPDYAAAVKSIAMLVKLIEEARAGNGAGAPAGTPSGKTAPGAGPSTARGQTAPTGPQKQAAGEGGVGLADGPAPAAAPPGPGAPPPGPVAGPPPAAPPPPPPAPAPPGPAAAPAPANAADAPAPQAPADDAADTDKLAHAEAKLAWVDGRIAAYMAIAVPGSAEATPAAWTGARGKIDAVLLPMRGPGGVIVAKKIGDALKAMDMLANAVAVKIAEKTTFRDAVTLAELRLVPLDRHPQAAAAPQIAPKIAAVRAEIAKAVAKADGQDFKSATKLLGPLSGKCDAIEKLADDLAHYNSILPQRTTAANTVYPLGGAGADAEHDKIQLAMVKLLNDAAKLATKEKLAEAVKKLDQIPPLFDRYQKITVMIRSYRGNDQAVADMFTALDAKPADSLKPFKAQIAKWKKDHAAAKYAKTKDYVKSVDLLSALIGVIYTVPAQPAVVGPPPVAATPEIPSYIEVEIRAHEAYQAVLKDVEAQIRLFKPHKGREGVEEFYQSLERDLALAKSEANSGKNSVAAAILERSRSLWPDMKTRADECEAYILKRDGVAAYIAAVKPMEGAADGIAEAEALMATGAKEAQAKDYKAAKASVDAAEDRAAEAKKAAEAKAALDKLKDGAALDGAAADLAPAIKVYDDMRAHVAAQDTTNDFGTELAAADSAAQKARDEAAKPAPDAATARAALDAGIALLEALLPKVMAHGPHLKLLGEVKTLAAGLTGAGNPDNCIGPRKVRADKAISDAEDQAKTPGRDYAGAAAHLVNAREIALKAAADAALWPDIRDNRAKIDNAKIAIETEVAAAAIMGGTLKRLRDAITAIDAQVAAEDFAAAVRFARIEGTAADETADDLDTAKLILDTYKTDYLDINGQITGADSDKVQSQVDQMNAKHAEFVIARDAGNYDAALRLIYGMRWAIEAGTRMLTEYAAFDVARTAAKAKLDALRAVRNAGVEAEVLALEKRYADAEALSASEKHKPAETAMLALPDDIDDVTKKAGEWKDYDDALTIAQQRIGAMESHAQAEAMRPMVTALRGKLAGAVSTAGKGDLVGAATALKAIPAEADKAIATADKAGDLADKAGQIGDGPIDPALLAEARALIDSLSARSEAAAAQADLDLAEDQLNQAESTPLLPENRQAALKEAMAACTRAEITISQQELVKEALTAARADLAAVTSHAEAAYVAEKTAAIAAELDAVEADSTKNGPDVVGNRIRTAVERIAAAKVLADKQAEYKALRAQPGYDARLPVLEGHAHRYAIKPSIDTFRKKLEDAAAKSDAMEPAAAIDLLKEAEVLGQSALVMAEMRANNAPSIADLAKILSGPGGEAALDAMIDQLEPDAQREVLHRAFEARFGVKLSSYTGVDADGDPDPTTAIVAGTAGVLDARNIKQFYDIMMKLPKEHVVNNDSMREFTHVDDGSQGSYYSGTTKEVVMRESGATWSSPYGVAREHEVGDTDPDCEPANDDEVTYFSWNTLHEVGHAVDDRNGFMNSKQGGDEYGGWTAYINDTTRIAKAINTQFKYDETYIGQFLQHNASPVVPAAPETGPNACSPEEWESRRIAFEAWAQLVFESNKPWNSNSVAQRVAINNVVYQESYGNNWYSYKVAARKKAITGYQFRAPGEWFAELYAAYHSDKLKPAHPAVKWLKDL